MTLFEQQLNCSDMLYDFFDNRVFSLRNHESSLKIYDSLTNVDVCICRTVLCCVQVNLFQTPSFLHQLTHSMTRDCSLNSPKNTRSKHVVYKYCFECQTKTKKYFLYTTGCELVLSGEFNEQSSLILWVN